MVKSAWHGPVLLRVATLVRLAVFAAALCGAYFLVCRLVPHPDTTTPDAAVRTGPSDPDARPSASAVPPPIEAAGWVNGRPPLPGSAAPRLIVLDVWADW
jgi:hypothetical protein